MTMFYRHAFGVVALMACVVLAAEPAFAATDIAGVLTNITTMLTTGVAKSIAVLAIMATGFAWMWGMFDMRQAGMVLFGIALVFGAPTIAASLGAV